MPNIDQSKLTTAASIASQALPNALNRLAAVRWRAETGGIVLSNGRPMKTTAEAQAKISSAVLMLQTGAISGPIRWKYDDGFADISGNDLALIAHEVAAHIQACFTAESVVAAQLAADPDPDNFDVSAAFVAALSS